MPGEGDGRRPGSQDQELNAQLMILGSRILRWRAIPG
jgi:hypothetical protein